MSELIHPIVLILGLGALIGAELKVPSFKNGAIGPGARRHRNWSFLFAALFTAGLLRVVGELARRSVPGAFDWSGLPVLEAGLCFLLADLLGFFLHYVKHQSALLWRFHLPHHRERHYDVWLVTHTHSLEVLVSGAITSIALAACGFSPAAMQLYFTVYTLAKTYQHSGHDYSLGLFDRVLVGPAYHRHHHVLGAHQNFGIVLTLFDVLFGTVRWPAGEAKDDLVYGTSQADPYGFVAEMTYFLQPTATEVPAPATTGVSPSR